VQKALGSVPSSGKKKYFFRRKNNTFPHYLVIFLFLLSFFFFLWDRVSVYYCPDWLWTPGLKCLFYFYNSSIPSTLTLSLRKKSEWNKAVQENTGNNIVALKAKRFFLSCSQFLFWLRCGVDKLSFLRNSNT
jgi:hypothetical protein